MKRYINIAMIIGIILFLYSFVNFSLNQLWDWVSTVSLILGIIIGSIAIYYRFQFRQKELNIRFVKYGANTVLSALIVLGIMVLLAFITNRHHVRKDLTSQGLYSLAEQTKSVLNDLNKEVQIYAFYKKSDEIMARDLLEEYAYRSKFTQYEFVDPNEQPQLARRYNVTQYNTVVVESGIKRETINEFGESNLTNAIIKVTRELDKVIYFTTGHGERNIEGETPQDYKQAVDGITSENYMVKSINLAEERKIPRDCSVLVSAGPKADFFPFELDSIKSYIEGGGKYFVMLDPQININLMDFLTTYKFQFQDDLVVDASGVGQLFGMGPEIPLVSNYEDHEIFKDFSVMTFYPQARSIGESTEGEEGFTTTILFKSSPSSWGEIDYKNRQVAFDADRDLKGPVPLAVVSTKSMSGNKKAQILVMGDSDFAASGYIQNSGNKDLFLNIVNWLAEEEDMITIRPKEIDDRRVNLTAKDSKIILYVSVFALPLLVVIAGVFVYFKRR
ncbi:MAG: GldG family protein [Calditrichia bacterium]|nr:GldG family protein [Calditrichia bacterium]